MHLILHIGSEKTGTTSIQSFLKDRRQALISENIWCSLEKSLVGHSSTVVYAAAHRVAPDVLAQFGIFSDEDLERFRTEHTTSLGEEIAEASRNECTKFIISDELLQSRCYEDVSLGLLSGLFKKVFSKITIICGLRPQADLFRSSITELARAGVTIKSDYHEVITPDDIYYNYEEMLFRWEKAFPEATINVLPFLRPLDGNIINSFNQAIGITERVGKSELFENISLPYEAIALSNALRIPRAIGTKAHPRRNLFLHEATAGDKLSFPEDLIEVLNNRFIESNKSLVNRYQGQIEMSDLTSTTFSDQPNYSKIFALDDYGDYFSWLIERFNAEIWTEKAKTIAFNGLLAVEHLNGELAETLLKETDEALSNVGPFSHPNNLQSAETLRQRLDEALKKLTNEERINSHATSLLVHLITNFQKGLARIFNKYPG